MPETPDMDREIEMMGLRSQWLADEYFAHQAALLIARDPRAKELLPPIEPGQVVPIFRMTQGDGTAPNNCAELHFSYFLERGLDERIAGEFDRTFLAGGLIRLGDELSRRGYLDRAPELELIRHLRNGVAHGNRFDIRNPGRLKQHPAHTFWMHGLNANEPEFFEIKPELNGKPVLFDFIGPLSLARVFVGVSFYLLRMAHHEPLRGGIPEARLGLPPVRS